MIVEPGNPNPDMNPSDRNLNDRDLNPAGNLKPDNKRG